MTKLKDYLEKEITDYSICGMRCDKDTYNKFHELRKYYKVTVRVLIIALINKEYDEFKNKENNN